MSEHSFDDPQLAAWEAQLAAATLSVSPQEQQRLLYQCGIAAGQKGARKSLRRWRIVSGALAISLACMSIPHFAAQHTPVSIRDTPQQIVQSHAPVELDAWQSRRIESAPSSDELARLTESDPRLSARTVGALTRQALESKQPL